MILCRICPNFASDRLWHHNDWQCSRCLDCKNAQSTSSQKRLYYRKKRIFAYISCDNAPHTIS